MGNKLFLKSQLKYTQLFLMAQNLIVMFLDEKVLLFFIFIRVLDSLSFYRQGSGSNLVIMKTHRK